MRFTEFIYIIHLLVLNYFSCRLYWYLMDGIQNLFSTDNRLQEKVFF